MVTITTGRRAGYLDTAVRAALDAIAAASTPGSRILNTTLYNASMILGQLVAGGELDPTTTEDTLVDAAVKAGHPAGPARKTVRSGFRAGARRPRSTAA